MLPKIIISRNRNKIESFISEIIAQEHVPTHAIQRISPEKKELTIGQIRDLKKQLIVARKEVQLIIIESFHKASLEAQNAFLKTLEEKNEQNIFLLVAESVGSILPTIISRAQVTILDQQFEEVYQTQTEVLQKLIQSKGYSVLGHQSVQGLDSDKAKLFLEAILANLKKLIPQDTRYTAILKKTLQNYALLENNNANPQLLVDSLLIFIRKRID